MFYLLTVVTMFAALSIFTLYGYKKGINFPDGGAIINKRNTLTKEDGSTALFLILIASLIPILGFSFLSAIGLLYVCHFLYTKILTSGGLIIGTYIANFINEKVLKNGK